MATFYSLTVTGIRKTIAQAVEVTLVPDDADKNAFRFAPGQFLTFRTMLDGQEIRRNYSICSGAGGPLVVGIKQVEGGAFSTWANTRLAVGDRIDAMAPQGRFFEAPGHTGGHVLGFAGGSGITPVLSILRTVLAADPTARFTLVYANRSVSTIMFREELEDLKNRYMGRLSVIHVLEQDAQGVPLFEGRLDAEKCAALFGRLIQLDDVTQAYICGPEPMMQTIASTLRDHGVDDNRIRYELFTAPQQGRLEMPRVVTREASAGTELSVVLDGARHSVRVDAGQTVLEAVLAAGIEAPYSCRAGVCSTCICRVESGSVEMIRNHALEDYEVEQGYALSCQALPQGAALSVVYEDH